MKSLWTAVSFLAVVNLLALLMFTGWLYQTDRLNEARLNALRDLFRLPVSEAEQLAAEEAAAEEKATREAGEAYRAANPLPPAAQQIAHLARLEDRANEFERRAQAEIEALRGQLLAAQKTLASEREAFAKDKAAWQTEVDQVANTAADAQFQRVVALLGQLRPKQAKELLMQWATGGDMLQAVKYLNAMNPRLAAKVLAEFKDDETQVARELLERLRTLGQATAGPEDAQNAPTPVDPG